MPKLATTLLPALLALPLAGCIKFGAEPPPSLMTLDPAVSLPVGTTQNSGAAKSITVMVPTVPQELATARVPVHSSGTTIAYVKEAQWVEQPSRLFARLLSDTITARTGRVVLSLRQSLADPGSRLTGELRTFGIDARSGEAVVVYDAALVRGDTPVFEKRRFETRVPVAPVEAGPVGVALNQAANQVAADVADWIGR